MSTAPSARDFASPQSEYDVATGQTTHAASNNVPADRRADAPIIYETPLTASDEYHGPALPETPRDESPANGNSDGLSEAVDFTAIDAPQEVKGYCWLSLLPHDLRRSARKRYPPCLDLRLVHVLRDKLGPDTQLAYTVTHMEGVHFFHVRPGVGTTLAELCLMMDCDSYLGIDITMSSDDLQLFVLPNGSTSPSGSDSSDSSHGSFSLDNPPVNPPLPEYNNHPLEIATEAEVWAILITIAGLLPQNDPLRISAREVQYLSFRQLGGRKYDSQFADLVQGPGAVIMPSSPFQYFRPRTRWLELRVFRALYNYCGANDLPMSRRAWQSVVDAIGGFCYLPVLLTQAPRDYPWVLAGAFGPHIERSNLYAVVCERGLGSVPIYDYPPYDRPNGTRVSGHFSVHQLPVSRPFIRHTLRDMLNEHTLNSLFWGSTVL